MNAELTKQLLDLCRKWHCRAHTARVAARLTKTDTTVLNKAFNRLTGESDSSLMSLREQYAISDSLDDCANDLSDLVYQIIQSQSTQPTDTHS